MRVHTWVVCVSAGGERGRQGHEARFQATHCTGMKGTGGLLTCWALQVKRNHAGLSDQLLRVVRALDALEGRFAEQSHHHNSKTHQVHEALSQDLAQLEAVMAPNSAGKRDLL